MNDRVDTIAAIATATGQSGVGVIRVSGPDVHTIIAAMIRKMPTARIAEFHKFRDDQGAVIDEGLVLLFPGPNSFTGEDVVEFHGHGGMIVQDLLLTNILKAGARQARPGEFSERAFLNNKMDLTQAEAICDLISASSEQAARSAVRSLQGDFAKHIRQLVTELIELRVYIEAAIDFPDEELDLMSEGVIDQRIQKLQTQWQTILASAKQGALLRDGIRVVIAGKPNVGKSSLLNALSGVKSAIVTAVPGTTRDVLRERITIDGMPMHVIDTAGIRASDDQVELEGIKRAHNEIEQADCVLLVEEFFDETDNEIKLNNNVGKPIIKIKNKIDLATSELLREENVLYVSAQTHAGLDELRAKLKEIAGYQDHQQGCFIARRRHIESLSQAKNYFDLAERQLRANQGELVAEELRLAQKTLGEITGEFTNEDLLGEIFSNFCIGK